MATIPIASFSGLATGLDTSALISSLVGLERRPITRLQSQQTALNAQSSKLASIKTKLAALQTAARDMDLSSEIQTVKATASDTSVLGVTAVAGASVGTYSVVVTSLASAERTYSDPILARDQAGLFGEGTLGITIGGVTKNVVIAPTDTLDAVATKINSAGAGVTASVIDTGSGFRLSVNGTGTGTANAVSFTEGGTLALDLDDPLNELQPATNAVFSIDNIPMSRTSNSIANAIGGVTLDLKAAKPGVPITVTVDRDPGALRAKVETFVKAYNDVMTSLNAEFAWTGKAKGTDSLNGDLSLRQLQTRLGALKSTSIDANPEQYRTLAGIGVTTAKDGTLTFDGAKLDAAMAASPTSVLALLAKSSTGGVDGVMAQMAAGIDEWTSPSTGVLSAKIDGISKRVKGIDAQIAAMELRIDKYEEGLRKQFASLETLVSNLQGQGSQLTSMLDSMKAK